MFDDLRYSLRVLRRTPAFTVAAVSTLGLAIGATTAILSVAAAIRWWPFEIPDADRVVVIHLQGAAGLTRSLSYTQYVEVAGEQRTFEGISASGARPVVVTIGDTTQRVTAHFVAPRYFNVLGVRPRMGRTFVDADHLPASSAVAIVSEHFWRTALGSEAAPIGTSITISGRPVAIVGVGPTNFRGIRLQSPADLFFPLETAPQLLPRGNYFSATTLKIDGQTFSPQSWLEVIGRLQPSVSIAQSEAHLSTVLNAQQPPKKNRSSARLLRVTEAALPEAGRQAALRFTTFLAAVVLQVLLVACAGLAGLLLARGEQRVAEVALRSALGAPGLKVARLFVLEAIIVATAAGILAIPLSHWMLSTIRSFVIPGGVRLESLPSGALWLGVSIAGVASAIAAILSGIVPAFVAAKRDIVSGLRGLSGQRRIVIRRSLVSAHVAISLILIVGASLFARSVYLSMSMGGGSDMSALVYVTAHFQQGEQNTESVQQFFRSIVERAVDLPDVLSSSYGGVPLVLNSGSNQVFLVDGVERTLPDTIIFDCGPNYFSALGIPLVAGRDFALPDTIGPARVVIVNEALARLLWPDGRILGRRLEFLPHTGALEVIGIAKDAKYLSLREQGRLVVYEPWGSEGPAAPSAGAIIVRTSGNTKRTVSALRQIVRNSGTTAAIGGASTMSTRLMELAAPQRLGATLLIWFAMSAVALATVALFGMVASDVVQKRREIAVRLALGAPPGAVIRSVVNRSLAPVIVGLVVGVGCALALARGVEAFLVEITAYDAFSYTVSGVILGLAALVASYAAARAAARVPLVQTLRAE